MDEGNEGIFYVTTTLANGTEVTIRSLKADDVDGVSAHFEGLPDHEYRWPTGGGADPGYLQPALDGRWPMLVAYSPDGQVIGEAIRYPLPNRQAEIAYSVAEGWRGCGVEAALINAVKEAAPADGVRFLIVHVFESNEAAVSLFTALRWELRPSGRARTWTYRTDLEPDQP